ncbi:MAG: NUDIX domain-containing protein [Gammaproteobacteria bacterium]|nr:NUDIX domain-containing protein [Gammaproteobacteria bacterium]
MPKRRPEAAITAVTPLYSGFLKVNRYELDIEKHDGSRYTRTWELMERGDAVAVLGYDPARDEVVLVNEIRPGALAAGEYPYLDNLVAGGVGEHEPVLEAAVRETKEETGLDLRDPVVVHPGAYVSSGGTTERVAIVFGLVDTREAGGVHGSPHESEDILTVVLPAQEFVDRVRQGELNDMKTLLAGYWFAEYRERKRSAEG